MKSVKECVYEYVQEQIFSSRGEIDGLATKEVAEALNMQRSNVSALLNELVKEGRLIKTNTRPVIYTLADNESRQVKDSALSQLIGANGSLKNAVQLAKAAVLYPTTSLNVLLSSKPGCGTTYFALLIYKFAIEQDIINKEGPYIKINCRHFDKNISVLSEELFGSDGDLGNSAFVRAKGGMLFIDNIDLLDALQMSRLYTYLETGRIYSEDKKQFIECHDLLLVLACAPRSDLQLNRMIPVTIELPELKERPLEERFELINHFFSLEAIRSKKSIHASVEVIQALLLADFSYNVKGLNIQIKSACANAYVRVVHEPTQDIEIVIDDFSHQVRSGLLKLKEKAEEIQNLIGVREYIYYDKEEGYQTSFGKNYEGDYYDAIKKQYEELSLLGINDQSIASIMNTHITNLFKSFSYHRSFDDSNNLEQLSKIVDERVIELVTDFFLELKKAWGREFKSNVFYGLCLHINALLTMNFDHKRIDNDQIVKIVEVYPKEYAAAVQFSTVLNAKLGLEIPIHETALIAMFLVEQEESEEGHPVLLYVMHGHSTASSLRDVTNSLTQCENAYSYDLALNMSTDKALKELKVLIEDIDQGQGVVVIYDMGSIKTMLETIQEQTHVKIRTMNIPLTLIGIDVARKCQMETDVDYVYHMANLELKNMSRHQERRNEIIVTLCHTGEGGAVQLKRYIDQYSKLGFKTIPLNISSRDELLQEVINLKKTYHIHSFVGTYDPKLFGIPYIPISKIFENSKEDLDRILMFEPASARTFNYDEVYNYLEEQFKYVSISKLKTVLPDIIDEFNVIYDLNADQRVGLFMHLACLTERLLEGKPIAVNKEKKKVISVFEDDYQIISRVLKPLEKTFKVIIDDNEITTVIMILKEI